MFLELTDWRRETADLYRRVREAPSPQDGHALWRAGRDAMFRDHPQSPLAADDPLRATGIPYWPYRPELRWSLPLLEPGADGPAAIVSQGSEGPIQLRRIGQLALPMDGWPRIDVWWLDQYAGGLWLPLRDGTAGATPEGSYGAGRYLLDTAKGADLGSAGARLIIDLNYLYHPSCRYSPQWTCPLAPERNRIDAAIRAGERMP